MFDAFLALATPNEEELEEMDASTEFSKAVELIKFKIEREDKVRDMEEGSYEVEFMYEGNDRDVFEKVLRRKFEGDDSLRSKMTIVYYLAMFDSLLIMKEHIVNGETALDAITAIVDVMSNTISATIINAFPHQLHEETMKLILVGIVKSMPEFLEKAKMEQDEVEKGKGCERPN